MYEKNVLLSSRVDSSDALREADEELKENYLERLYNPPEHVTNLALCIIDRPQFQTCLRINVTQYSNISNVELVCRQKSL